MLNVEHHFYGHSLLTAPRFCLGTPLGTFHGSLHPSGVWSGVIYHLFICEGTKMITQQSSHPVPTLDSQGDCVFVNCSVLKDSVIEMSGSLRFLDTESEGKVERRSKHINQQECFWRRLGGGNSFTKRNTRTR